MKILFYDIKENEFDYFASNVTKELEPYFFKYHLNSCTYIDKQYLDCEAVCVFVTSVLDEVVLTRFKNLKYIFLRGSGYSNIDLKYCKKRNIKVFNTPNYAPSSIAEFAFGLVLALSRKIINAQKSVKEGNTDYGDLAGFELNSKTLGLIGAGHIGERIIQIACGFNMDVIVYDIDKSHNYRYVEFDELLQNSDVIILACPLNKSTKGMIDQKALNKMKKSAILVNVARGEIIDTRALTDSLVKRKISACALDVIECEEKLCELWNDCVNTDKREHCLKKFLFIRKLKSMNNVIITPHIAYNTKEALREICKITLKNILSIFKINSDNENMIML